MTRREAIEALEESRERLAKMGATDVRAHYPIMGDPVMSADWEGRRAVIRWQWEEDETRWWTFYTLDWRVGAGGVGLEARHDTLEAGLEWVAEQEARRGV